MKPSLLTYLLTYFQAASYRALVEGLRERLCAAGGRAVEVDEAAYDEQVSQGLPELYS